MPSSGIRLRGAVVVRNGDRVLLVPHIVAECGSTQWTLPGGAVQPGESLRDAAGRETFEETGLRVRPEEIAEVIEVIEVGKTVGGDESFYHSVTVCFAATVVGGSLLPEHHPRFGLKSPAWLSLADRKRIAPHHRLVVEQALSD